jgi:hypothetical protein
VARLDLGGHTPVERMRWCGSSKALGKSVLMEPLPMQLCSRATLQATFADCRRIAEGVGFAPNDANWVRPSLRPF